MSRISIIIPIYNVEKYLPRCLDSVLNQTFKDWQAILVDDGSTDKSGKIADKYARHDKRFVVVHKENSGVSDTRNYGVKKARSEYLMFLDADDVLHPQTIEIAYKFATENNADIVSFKYDKKLYDAVAHGADSHEMLEKRCSITYKNIKYKTTDKLINYATERNHSFGRFKIRHCYPVVHLYKYDLVKNIKFNRDIKISEDFPFWTSVLLCNPKAVVLDLPLYFYIPNNTSALKSADSKKVFDNVAKAIMTAYKDVVAGNQNTNWIKVWQKEFLWPFIIICMRAASGVADTGYVKKTLIKMEKLGVFESPQTMRARKYKRRIEKIISQIS